MKQKIAANSRNVRNVRNVKGRREREQIDCVIKQSFMGLPTNCVRKLCKV